MANVKCLALAVAAVFIYTGCAKDALANDANAANSTENTTPAGPPRELLVTLEKSAYAAWKSKDAKLWDAFLSDKFVGWGRSGKRSESWTYLGHIDLRKIRRCLEVDLWDKRPRTRRGYLALRA